MDNHHIRIATVYRSHFFREFHACDMSLTRWLRISEALAELGYQVDMIVNCHTPMPINHPNLNSVRFSDVNWSDYDVIKTLFHLGFEALEEAGGADHPYIISKLGSVVGPDPSEPGVYFYGEEHRELFNTQKRMSERCRYISILTPQSQALWERVHGNHGQLIQVPTGVDESLPMAGANPYRRFNEKIVLYLGNIYADTQPEINRLWQNQLNEVGTRLAASGMRLCLVGPGNTDLLDPDAVTRLGSVDQSEIWDYLYYADVGIALAQGKVQHNESSKIYYYLRTGLPVVCEEPIPNAWMVSRSGHGYVVPYWQNQRFTDSVVDAASRKFNYLDTIEWIRRDHGWLQRAGIYANLLRSNPPGISVESRGSH